MKALTLVILLFLLFRGFSVLGADGSSNQGLFIWSLLWTGSWYKSVSVPDGEFPQAEDIFAGGTFYNRGNFTLAVPSLDSSLRILLTDKRLLPFTENDPKAGFNPAIGLYHQGSGSRFLYGVQNYSGLPARINSIWLRSLPFMESRQPYGRDLKLEPAARDTADTYLHLGLPRNFLAGFDAFAAATLDSSQNLAVGAGMSWYALGPVIRLEGFYTQKELPMRDSSTWFSSSPPLPERDFAIYAMGLAFHSGLLAFATDLAWSETYAWGEGLYGNFTLRLGHRPWRLSLAADAAGGRFADRGGAATNTGLRLAGRTEYFWPRSGLLRVQGSLRSRGLEEVFDRFSFSAYYRRPAPTALERRENTSLVRFSRAQVSLGRDARQTGKSADSLNALAAFNVGLFNTALTLSLNNISALGNENGGLFQFPLFETFDSFRAGGEIIWRAPNFRLFNFANSGSFDLRTRLGYTIRSEREPILDFSVNCSFRPGRWGRVSFRIASTDFPEKWNYTLSWRFEN